MVVNLGAGWEDLIYHKGETSNIYFLLDTRVYAVGILIVPLCSVKEAY